MKKIFLGLVFLLISAVVSFGQITLPDSLLRYSGFPLDPSAIFNTYEAAVTYAEKGATGESTAYKGQYIAVPNTGVYYIDDNWLLQDMGGSFTAIAGENALDGDIETLMTKELYFKMTSDTNYDYTTFTTITNIETGQVYPTLLIPRIAQRGLDGSNFRFGGYWDGEDTYPIDTVVAYDGSLYASLSDVPTHVIPPENTNYWMLIVEKGAEGARGPAGTIEVGSVSNGPAGSLPVITNRGTAENAILDFTIPKGDKGDPGVGLTYAGYWTNTTYRSNTVVRKGTNLWYTVEENDENPDLSETWSIFLTDGYKGDKGETGARGFTGPKGDPGNTFGIYAGAWDTSKNYVSNMWVTWNGGTYGILTDLTAPLYPTPADYSSSEIAVLSLSGKNGTDGKDGIGATPMGDWDKNVEYTQYDLVRYKDAQYYCAVSSSYNQNPENYPTVWVLFLKDGLNISDAYVTTNAFWAGKFELVNYVSNSVVYWNDFDYGTYYVLKNCTPDDYGRLSPIQLALNNTNYFVKIANYGRDGARGPAGTPGRNGTDGKDGADGFGNMWFAGEWTNNILYPTNYIVSTSNSINGVSLYVSIAESSNICPVVTLNWERYWELLLKSGKDGTDGRNGGNYRFMFGWSPDIRYDEYDTCVVSNNFYVCRQSSFGPNEAPWLSPIGTNKWTKLISPDYRYYGLSPSRSYAPNMVYVSNELVRYQGSTYVVLTNEISNIIPSSDTNVWAVFAAKGDKGDKGNQGIQGETGPRGERGFPGINLVYFGNWNSTNEYQAASLVRYGTNLWYCEDATAAGQTPGTSEAWEIYLRDGKAAEVFVSTNTITLLPTQKAEVVVTPETGGNNITLQFKIPQGVQGIQGIQGEQGLPGVDTVYYGNWVSGSNYPAESLVRLGTNLWYTVDGSSNTPGESDDWKIFLTDGRPASVLVSTNTITLLPDEPASVVTNYLDGGRVINLQFKIPKGNTGDIGPVGPKGDPGVDVIYQGEYVPGNSYSAKSLVRYETNLWYCLEDTSETPSHSATDWNLFLSDGSDGKNGLNGTNATIEITGATAVGPNDPAKAIPTYSSNNTHVAIAFEIPRGQNGTNATIEVSGTSTGNPGTDARVDPTYSSNNTHVALAFTIPKGDKGDKGEIGSTYFGQWIPQTYASNSLVRNGTNLWYASTNMTAEDEPGTSSLWLEYLNDGPKGEQGETGLTIYPQVGGTTNLPAGSDAVVTNLIDGTNSYFYFEIPQGPRGEQGEKGASLLPRGNYSETNEYVQYDLVRYDIAQYYVYVETPTPISGIVPTNTDYWTMFVKDGEGIAANATLIKKNETEYPGPLFLDTNTLTVTNIDDIAHLTVVGGVGGDTSQWDIDINGGVMPAADMVSGPWDYDDDGDLMPPTNARGGRDGGGGGGWSPTSRTIIEQSATVTTNDYLIWMDGITNQTLTFPELNIDAMTVIVRQLSDGHSTEISLYNTTNTITLYDQGDSMTFDYLNGFGWFWR